MSTHADFLFEIGTEELPTKSILPLSVQLSDNLKQAFVKEGLTVSELKHFATPRRIAVLATGLPTTKKAHEVIRRGPSVKAAFNDKGEPTKACIGFAKSNGVEVDALEREKTDKGEWLIFKEQVPAKPVSTLLPKIIINVLKNLQLPQDMKWGANEVSFIRPVHWVVLIFDNNVIKMDLLNLKSGNESYGHRFLHPEKIILKKEKDYEKELQSSFVIADFDKRKKEIQNLITSESKKLKVICEIDQDLLEEVTGLVEYPVILSGNFDKRFLKLPKEVLVTTIQYHQKAFPLENNMNQLVSKFIIVSHIKSKDPSKVILGNERVMAARLADAEFFYHSDMKRKLSDYLQFLSTILFHEKLGTLLDKSNRLSQLILQLNLDSKLKVDAARAGQLSKFDLCTDMVKEFPELQGIIGYYYAKAFGEKEEVAIAIKEQYWLEELPNTSIGCALALSDKFDHLIGYFGIGLIPSGIKDPFSLRRAAVGIVRIVIEKKLKISLRSVLSKAYQYYDGKLTRGDCIERVYDYILERMKSRYIDAGTSIDVINSVFALHLDDLYDIHNRIIALKDFNELEYSKALSSANKRVGRILLKSEFKDYGEIDESLFEGKVEKKLAKSLKEKRKEIEPYLKKENYIKVLESLAKIRPEIDDFFDNVMIMVEDEKIRNNRLNLLYNLQQLFLTVADISKLHTETN